jgi:hypothetical protein
MLTLPQCPVAVPCLTDVRAKRIGEWTFYKRDERAIRAFHQLCDDL